MLGPLLPHGVQLGIISQSSPQVVLAIGVKIGSYPMSPGCHSVAALFNWPSPVLYSTLQLGGCNPQSLIKGAFRLSLIIHLIDNHKKTY